MKARHWLIDEVIQSSTMDCGPAALTSLLRGCGIPVSYPRLRETCHTDVDGTAIDTLEDVASRYGLEVEQVMLPLDEILPSHNANLPCIAVTQQPNGMTHFVTVWSCHAGLVQCMDPAMGRRWLTRQSFLNSLYQHKMPVAVNDWEHYARSEEFSASLAKRLALLGFSSGRLHSLVTRIRQAPDWTELAYMDAAVRYCHALVQHAALAKRTARQTFIALVDSETHLFPGTSEGRPPFSSGIIPEEFYQVMPIPGEPGQLLLKGAVLVRVISPPESAQLHQELSRDPVLERTLDPKPAGLLRKTRHLMPEEMSRSVLLRSLGGVLSLGVLTLVEALIFRYLLNVEQITSYPELGLMILLVTLPLLAGLLIERSDLAFVHRLGRALDARLRLAILRKLPRLPEGYFSSRLVSDLAERGHAITELRQAPELMRRLGILITRLSLVLLGLIWLMPEFSALVLGMGAVIILSATILYPLLNERDLRTRTHLGALSRFYLDSLRGSEAIWSHSAETAVRNEQNEMLSRWWLANLQFFKPLVLAEWIQSLFLVGLAATLVIAALQQNISPGTVLLIAYWSLLTPFLSRELLSLMRQLPAMRSIALRVFEIIDAEPSEVHSGNDRESEYDSMQSAASGAVALELNDITVSQGEVDILKHVSLHLNPGEKVALVGNSGSGKSSLVNLLLGWQLPRKGKYSIDGAQASPARIAELRENTVWLDPDIYLWNRSAIENLMVGHTNFKGLASALEHSEFLDDLHRMKNGLATRVGENGSRLSGGESQRLRTARALLRSPVRLVLLDEPFRGMASQQRQQMSRRLSQHWEHTTQLFISHDISDTLEFPRVVVMHDGRIVEDGTPRDLAANPASHYAQLLADEERLKNRLLHSNIWRHLKLEQGQVEQVTP